MHAVVISLFHHIWVIRTVFWKSCNCPPLNFGFLKERKNFIYMSLSLPVAPQRTIDQKSRARAQCAYCAHRDCASYGDQSATSGGLAGPNWVATGVYLHLMPQAVCSIGLYLYMSLICNEAKIANQCHSTSWTHILSFNSLVKMSVLPIL